MSNKSATEPHISNRAGRTASQDIPQRPLTQRPAPICPHQAPIGHRSSGIERMDQQFHADFFNLFNIVNVGLPANTLLGSGRVTPHPQNTKASYAAA
jgi:hypothetical protein